MGIFDQFKTKVLMPQPLERAKPELEVPAVMTPYQHTYAPSALAGPVSQYIGNQSQILTITESGLTGLPAANYCVNDIAHHVAVMLTHAHVVKQGKKQDVKPTILTRPNFAFGPYEFFHQAVSTAIVHGNYIAVIGETQLVPVHPCNVELRVTEAGYPIYKIGQRLFSYDQILHVRGAAIIDYWGVGVIERHRAALIGSVDMQNYSNSVYRTGAVPTIVVSSKGKLPAGEVLDDLATSWATAFQGSQRKPVFIGDDATITPLNWTPEDTQFLQARATDIATTALMFGYLPGDLQTSFASASGSVQYANITAAQTDKINRVYAPWLYRFEQAFSDLIGNGAEVQGNREALLRMDPLSQAQYWQIMTSIGATNADEIRALQDKEPLQPKDTNGQTDTNSLNA